MRVTTAGAEINTTSIWTRLYVVKMHRLFIKNNPDLMAIHKYSLYYKIFNEFNISFGFPRSNICDFCERQQVVIKAAEVNSNATEKKEAEVEHDIHIRKAEVFGVQLNKVMSAAKIMESSKTAMDYEKNLPLPSTGVSRKRCKRQLWQDNLCIHNNANDQATMFLNSDHFAGKVPIKSFYV